MILASLNQLEVEKCAAKPVQVGGSMSYLRRLPKFEYIATGSIDEACDLLAVHSKEAGLLAGGTDLLLQMRRRETSPAYIIGLKGVDVYKRQISLRPASYVFDGLLPIRTRPPAAAIAGPASLE